MMLSVALQLSLILGDETFVESIYKQHVDEVVSDVKEISRLERRSKIEPLDSYFAKGVGRASGIAAAYRSGNYSQREIADYCGCLLYTSPSPRDS